MTHSFLQKPFPFDLPIEGGFLRCEKLLRTVPGSRLIIAGRWQQKPVLAKIFLKPLGGWLEFNRELRGTQALLAARIATPAIVYAGQINPAGTFVILFEFLSEAVEFERCFHDSLPLLERLALLRQLVQTIAKQHQMSIVQTDLHLKNFLFANHILYSVDTGSVRIQKKPLLVKQSLASFALLLAQMALMEDALKTDVIALYFQLRGWSLSPKLLVYLNKQTLYWQKKREKTLRSKLFRSSTGLAAEKNTQRFWVCDRAYLTEEFLAFLKAPEYLFAMDNMRMIKEGGTTTVGVIQLSNQWFLVKRYNIKNFWHRLKRLVTKTRAKKSWENAHQLIFRGINTPKPVAMIENRWGIFRGVCYFISEYVPGITASEYFKPHQFDLTQGYVIAQKILKILSHLVKHKICHGDLKASNILINEEGVWLLDLDATRFYRHHFYFKPRAQKDKIRFMRNWQGQPMIRNLFE